MNKIIEAKNALQRIEDDIIGRKSSAPDCQTLLLKVMAALTHAEELEKDRSFQIEAKNSWAKKAMGYKTQLDALKIELDGPDKDPESGLRIRHNGALATIEYLEKSIAEVRAENDASVKRGVMFENLWGKLNKRMEGAVKAEVDRVNNSYGDPVAWPESYKQLLPLLGKRVLILPVEAEKPVEKKKNFDQLNYEEQGAFLRRLAMEEDGLV